MPAHPFGYGPRDRKGEYARRARQTQMPDGEIGGQQCRPDIKRERCREPGSGDRHQPPETGDIDEQRGSDPIEAADEKTETKGVPQAKGRPRPGASVIKPQEAGKGHQQQRGQINRRQRRGGAHTEQKGEPITAPAGCRGEAMGQAAERGLDPRAGPNPQHRCLRHRLRLLPRLLPAVGERAGA